jgi:hypothetical protein
MIHMADLIYGETHVSTVTQLCGNGEWKLNVEELAK